MPSKPCTDHLGNKFDSQKEMCQHWNIEPHTFRERQKLGWSLKESLCGRQLNRSKKPSIDHLGNKFNSQKEMCQHWNIEPHTFRNRQKLGWSLKESFCGRQLNRSKKPSIDHLGNKFDSQKEMCQYWNIEPHTFRERQKQDWSLEESLCGKKVTDPLGNKFDSQKEMCQYWNINQAIFQNRQKLGWSLPESLGIIPRLNVTAKIPKAPFRNYNLTPNITIINNVPDTDCYFICLVNNKDKTIYHRSELINEYTKYNKK